MQDVKEVPGKSEEVRREADELIGRILDPKTDGSRYPLYARMREIAPVHRSGHPLFEGWYLISGFDNCRTALLSTDAELNGRMLQAMNIKDDGVHDNMVRRWLNVRNDPAEHDVLRKMFFPYFTPRAIAKLRIEVRQLIDKLLDDIGDRESFDIVSDFCFPLPSMVIARLLGIPLTDMAQFQRMIEERAELTARTQALGPDGHAQRDVIAKAFLDLFRHHLELRRKEPEDDLISYAAAAAAEAGVNDDDLLAQFVFLLIAGHSTTADAIANAIISLDRFPDQRQLLIDGKVEMKKAIDELMRLDSSIQTAWRYTRNDLTVAGVTIPADSKVLLLLHSAHHDPSMFEDPDTLDLNRKAAGQAFPFGGGRHFCLGQALAKIELEDALTAFLDRFPNYRVQDIEWQGASISHGPKRLTIIRQ